MKAELKSFLIDEKFSIREAMRHMSHAGQKTLFIVDDKARLAGSLTDGDIRKWILSGGNLNEGVHNVCNNSPRYVREDDYDLDSVKRIMLELSIECVPVLGGDKCIRRILTWESVFSGRAVKLKRSIHLPVVIMAGGKGTRLDPFTRILPKPLIPIGEKPVIEHIMDKFTEYSVKEFFISINHKSRMIKSYFEDRKGRYKIRYLEEKSPLGTAGSLRLLKNKIKGPFIVTNCDIIINSDCSEIVRFHNSNNYDITLVVSCCHYVIPYGICEIENGGDLKHINEKPHYDFLINTGMYLMKEKVLDLIPVRRKFDLDELITRARRGGYRIGVFPVSENSWIDVGQWGEYRKAVEKVGVV